MNIKTTLTCFFVMLVWADLSCARSWRGITPLHSTRSDVERLLGPSEGPKENIAHFKFEDKTITVMYASGPPCGNDAFNSWQVPKGTVLSITVGGKKLRLKDLKLDQSKYKEKRDGHLPDFSYYVNTEEGLEFQVFRNEEVQSTTYFPASADNHLRCPESTKPDKVDSATTSSDCKGLDQNRSPKEASE